MFQRVNYENWQLLIPIVAFGAAAAFFVAVVWRALRLKRAHVNRLARMPTEDDSSASARHE